MIPNDFDNDSIPAIIADNHDIDKSKFSVYSSVNRLAFTKPNGEDDDGTSTDANDFQTSSSASLLVSPNFSSNNAEMARKLSLYLSTCILELGE